MLVALFGLVWRLVVSAFVISLALGIGVGGIGVAVTIVEHLFGVAH